MRTSFAARRAVRAVPVLLALGAAFLAIRSGALQTSPDPAGPSYLAYRIARGGSIAFAIDPRDDGLTLTIHVDAALVAARFPVEVVVEGAGGATLWRGHAIAEAPGGGAIADGALLLTAPRVLRLDPPAGGARLVVRVGDPGAGVAVVRLVRREPGSDAPVDDRARDTADRGAVFGWAYLPDDVMTELAARPFVRLAATGRERGGAELVHVRPLPRRHHAAREDEPGVLVSPLAGAAWTVRGSAGGRVTIVGTGPQGPGAIELETIDNVGRTTRAALPLLPFFTFAFATPAGGALTVTARCDDPRGVRVRAFVDGGAARLGEAGPAPAEILPDHRRSVLWRLAAGSPPLGATLLGDGTARVVVRPLPGVTPELSFRLLDPAGRRLAERSASIPFVPSRFDVALAAPGGATPASEPLAFVAAAPAGSRLEVDLRAGGVDLSFEAPDDDATPRVAAGYDVVLDETRLRHAPRERRRWVPFRPDDHAELPAVVLDGQVRLEPVGRTPSTGPYRAVEPLPPRTRQLLVERLGDARGRAHERSGFATGRSVTLAVAAGGADAGRLTLDYHVPPEALGGALRVWLDGALVEERRLGVARGRVRLDGVPPGAHEVRVEGAPGLILSRSPGGAPFAERAVWRLDRGATLVVPVSLDSGANETLHVVLYTAEPAGSLRLRAVVDRGVRGPGVRPAGSRTRLRRSASPRVEPTETRWLDRRGGARGRAHLAIPLHDDLTPGPHLVSVTLDDGPPRVHARFYVTGIAARRARDRLGVEWDED